MSKNEVVVKSESNQVAEVMDYKAKALEYLSSMGNKLPVKQQTQFLEMAQAFGLNPFKRELYAVGYGDNWNIITGYEVYLKRAERTGKLDGWETVIDGVGEQMSCTVIIYRKDWNRPFKHCVYYREVCQKTKDGKPNSVWSKMPSFMTKKVAVAQGFRMCFPDEFGGMPYTSDEMPDPSEFKDVTPKAKVETKSTESPSSNKLSKATKEKESAPIVQMWTQEQADELGEIMNSKKSDGTSIFSDEEKNQYRELLKNGQFEDAIASAKIQLKDRLLAISFETTEEETPAEEETPIF